MQLPLTQSLKNKTREMRLELAVNLMEILSPSTAKWFNNTFSAIHNVPRPFTKMLKAQDKPFLLGAEIGFGHGVNAENLLQELSINTLYCIDPYINQSYKQDSVIIQSYRNKETLKRSTKLNHDKRVTFIEKPSSEAAAELSHLKFDFIYIDGNHSYPYVKQDLALYTPLVRPGGFIGGHDYIFGQHGVIRAVQEHAIAIGKAPTIDFPDYWFKV